MTAIRYRAAGVIDRFAEVVGFDRTTAVRLARDFSCRRRRGG
jgi:hypothetical protein